MVRGVSNVEFLAGNVNDWDEPGAYDVVYARFLLQHLSEPVDMLRRMWAAARPGGRVIVEDPDFDGWCCHPPLPASPGDHNGRFVGLCGRGWRFRE